MDRIDSYSEDPLLELDETHNSAKGKQDAASFYDLAELNLSSSDFAELITAFQMLKEWKSEMNRK